MIKLNGCSIPPPLGGERPTMTITAKDKDDNVLENNGTTNSYPIYLVFKLDTDKSTYTFDQNDIIVKNGTLELPSIVSNTYNAKFTPKRPKDSPFVVHYCSVEVKAGSFSVRGLGGIQGCEGATNKDAVKFEWTQTKFPEDDS